jgi:hypothetical protein
MDSRVGVWIDHRKAVVATIAAEAGTGSESESIRQVTSDMEKHVRYSAAAQEMTDPQIAAAVRRHFLNSTRKLHQQPV